MCYALRCLSLAAFPLFLQGRADDGRVGDGSDFDALPWADAPLEVWGGLAFSSLEAGQRTTCGLLAENETAYCWVSCRPRLGKVKK